MMCTQRNQFVFFLWVALQVQVVCRTPVETGFYSLFLAMMMMAIIKKTDLPTTTTTACTANKQLQLVTTSWQSSGRFLAKSRSVSKPLCVLLVWVFSVLIRSVCVSGVCCKPMTTSWGHAVGSNPNAVEATSRDCVRVRGIEAFEQDARTAIC